MALLGQLIKSAIEFRHAIRRAEGNSFEIQQQQLLNLLQQAAQTSFGLYYGFEQLYAAKDPVSAFQESVPIHDYHQLHDRWWIQQQRLPGITWPGKPEYFALSSGTTGKKSKRIPVTDAMLSSFRSVGLAQAESLANFNLPTELFEKEILMLSSSSNLDERNGHLEGEISGINASNLPPWFGGFYRPGPEIAEIDHWDKRVAEIAEAAPDWDIGAIAGIPAWVRMMLETIIDRHQLKHIHEIWPNLSIYVSGGVAFEPYRKSLEQLLDHPLTYMDTYLASEGFFGYTARPGTMDMRLALEQGIFYEFIPFDERGFDETGNLLDNPEVLSIADVEEDQDYALLISTPAGAWRYMIGDTIKFTDLERFEMVISGRTKYFLNVAGSQLSEEKINAAIGQLSREMEVEIHEFTVAALKDEQEQFYHQWVIGWDNGVHADGLHNKLDNILKDLNKNYGVARQKALKGITVKTVPSEQIYNWLETKKKKGGQIKLPKVMKAEMMEDLMKYLQ